MLFRFVSRRRSRPPAYRKTRISTLPCLALPCLAIHLRPFQKSSATSKTSGSFLDGLLDRMLLDARTHFISRGKAIATVTTTSYALTVALKHAQHKPDSKSTMISPCPSTEGQARPLWSLPFEHAGTTSPRVCCESSVGSCLWTRTRQ